MQEQLDQKETLSALLDGEAGGDVAKFLARRIERDPEAAAQLGRWQFAGDALRARAAQNTEVDLRAALRQLLAADAAAAAGLRPRTWRWRWPLCFCCCWSVWPCVG